MTRAPKWAPKALSAPVPLRWDDEALPCRHCKLPTHWRTQRGAKVHPSCHISPWDRLTDEAYHEVVFNLAQTLGGYVTTPEPVVPTTYDMGPCAGCGKTTHRYGPGGRTHCATCRGDLSVSFVAPTLYDPTGQCGWCTEPGIRIKGHGADNFFHCRIHLWPPFRWPPPQEVTR